MWRDPCLGLAGALSPARAAQPVGWRAGRAVTTADFIAQAAGWFAHFQALAVGDVALHFEDTLHAAAALFGAWHARKTVWWPGDALPATAQRLSAQVGAFAGDWPSRPDAVAVVPDATAPAWQPLDPQARQLVVFTSGSSGEPTAIVKQLHQLFDEVSALEAAFGARLDGAAVHATVSHQHIYGLLFRVLWPLAAGRPIAAQRVGYLEDLHAAPGRIALVASPAHLKRLQLADTGDLPGRLAAVFSSGGPLPAEALGPCIERLGQTPIEVYGSSETGGVAWRQRPPGAGDGEPWQALPGVEWRLNDGALQLRSAHIGNHASSGWYTAADHARAEGAGFVLLGRADRIVKVEEKRVSLAAVEQALMDGAQVRDARALLLPGSRQELAVVLVPTPEAWALIDAGGRAAWLAPLRERLAAMLEATVRPRRWRLVSELPANTQGKTTQAALQALFDPMRPPARVLARELLSATLRLDIEARHPAFDGHFVGQPVLPGVVQLDWAERFARELFALQPAFVGLEQLKFQQVIRPGSTIELTLAVNAEGSELRFALTSERGPHASGKLRFGAAA
jgi:acyl-CoA synthetase (AMP-forming)/AMP-acid ligase II